MRTSKTIVGRSSWIWKLILMVIMMCVHQITTFLWKTTFKRLIFCSSCSIAFFILDRQNIQLDLLLHPVKRHYTRSLIYLPFSRSIFDHHTQIDAFFLLHVWRLLHYEIRLIYKRRLHARETEQRLSTDPQPSDFPSRSKTSVYITSPTEKFHQ